MNGVNISKDSVDNVTYKGTILKPELLSERVAYKKDSLSSVTQGVFNYVYEADGNTKVYFDDENKAFIIGNDLIKTYLTNEINRYKKVTIPQHKSGSWTYKEIYQSLYDGKWYDKNKENIMPEGSPGYSIEADKKFDYSAINYCVESYIVTEFLNSLGINNAGGSCICGYNHGNSLAISSDNNPELEDSDFSLHKRGIIKNVIESNLNQAMTSYSRNSSEGDYKLPKLTETDWDQILRNVSIITFIQNIPIGMKYYNNYAIATSTMNKEYVDPEEIYLNATGDNYYHMPYCKYFEKTENMIGYRSIDYVQKSYTQKKATGEDETKYYYKHSDTRDIDVNQACYYCLVQKSLYEENKTSDKINAYNTALARERYVARMAKLPPEIEASYYIRVTPYTIEEGKEIEATTAQYSINDVGYTGKGGTRINKNTVKYEIKPGFGDRETLDERSAIVTTDLGGYGAAKKTTLDSQNDNYSVYQSDSNATVKINLYNENGIKFNVDGKCEWTAGYSTDTTDKLTNLGPEADGYINIKLKYTRNYTDGGPDSGITATANIDSSDTLTIVTNTRDITGYVRLRFTNKDNEGNIVTYYSRNIFNVKNANSDIYCKIEGDYNWYNNNWKVEILNVAGETIKEAYTSYYTIRNVAGLKGFSNAVNGTVGPTTGTSAKTRGRIFKVIEDISDVGEMAPIAGKSKWFDGEFDGQGHTIKGVKINDQTTYKALGLFGRVGNPAKIENLTIDNIIITLAASNLGQKTGGLAGECDAGESINNITVKNSTIAGGKCVGGITGENKKEITNCNVDSVKLYSVNTKDCGSEPFEICVGGISGEAYQSISNCSVTNNSIIGSGNVRVTSSYSVSVKYYVGGIVGFSKAKIGGNIIIDNTTKVKGGKITHEITEKDEEKKKKIEGDDEISSNATGGIIGHNTYGDIIKNDDNNYLVECTIDSGNNNVGGIVGYNEGGNIDGIEFNGKISRATGKNIGGIVGHNKDKKISNCKNKVNIDVDGKNVGGIVGYTENGWIDYCSNEGKVVGNGYQLTDQENSLILNFLESLIKGNLDSDDMILDYKKNYEGTGGIAGKIDNATVSNSFNAGQIECYYRGGGIVGINYSGTIKYCFNNGTITNGERKVYVFNGTTRRFMNQLGGICGVASQAEISNSYNIGTIKGQSSGMNTPLGSAVGGIVGLLVNRNDSEKISQINCCYNSGKVEGMYNIPIAAARYNGAIAGFVQGVNTIFNNNIYLETSAQSGEGIGRTEYEGERDGKYNKYSSNDMKKQLYNWADSLIVPEGERDAGKFIYNTIAPVETDKGYEGYGVLWWEIEDYVKLETFIGVGDNEEQATKVIDDSNTTLTIGGKSVKLHDEYNIRKYKNKLDLHCWICYVKKDVELKAKASADYYDDSNEETISINEDGIKLLLLGGKSAKIILYPSGDASLDWIRTRTFTRECTQKEYYRTVGGVRTKRKTEKTNTKSIIGRWDSSTGNAGKLMKELSKSTLLEEDGDFGYVKLSGDGMRNFTLDDYDIKIEEYDAEGVLGEYSKSPTTKNTENISGDTESVTGVNSGVKFIIPIENIIDKTKDKELPFNKETSKITYGKVVINLVYFHNESKYNGPGAAPKDPVIVDVQFGNQEGQSQRKNLEWDWFSTKDSYNKKTFVFEFSESKDIPENIIVDFEWGADVTHMHVGIDNAYVEVNYKQ